MTVSSWPVSHGLYPESDRDVGRPAADPQSRMKEGKCSMRIVVTGAGGRIGRAVVRRLLEASVEIVGVDQVRLDHAHMHTIAADLCDLGQTYGALARADAVIHLAAIAAPVGLPPEVVYRNNVISQFNIFEAAAGLGIRRVVFASSISALGFPYQHRWSEPLYFPIDEDHPLLPQDCYALSKAHGEDVAAAFCRRGAGSAASLRFGAVAEPDHYPDIVAGVRKDPQAHAAYFWAYTDLRDAAEACYLAATAEFDGHQPMFITADDTLSEVPTDTLLDRSYPEVPRRTAPRPTHWSIFPGARAAALIGFSPAHHWRDCV